MSTERLASALALIWVVLPAAASGGEITITAPAGRVAAEYADVEGEMSGGAVGAVELSVVPFVGRSRGESFASVEVTNGRFRKRVRLLPGLNIIRAGVPGGGSSAVRVVYRASGEGSGRKTFRDWGKESPVVFSAPRDLKVTEAAVSVEGVVTDPEVTSVDLVALDTGDFFDDGAAGAAEIGYRAVRVENMRFAARMALREGLNIILARPAGAVAEEDIQVKSIIRESISGSISLEEPLLEDGHLIVRGRLAGAGSREVRVKVECLVEEEARPGRIRPRAILDERVATGPSGEFSLRKRVADGRWTIKSPPSIIVSAGGAIATKTLVKWR